jgi:hypothetical protein
MSHTSSRFHRFDARGGKLVAALASNRPTEVGGLRLEVAKAA